MTIPIKSFTHKKMSLNKVGQKISKEAQIVKRFDLPIIALLKKKGKK